jgi:hypothetical protein
MKSHRKDRLRVLSPSRLYPLGMQGYTQPPEISGLKEERTMKLIKALPKNKALRTFWIFS